MPSSHTTGNNATTSASSVSLVERVYSHKSPAVTAKAMPKKLITEFRPSITSPTTFAKPMIWMSILSELNLVRISSSFLETSA